MPTTRRQAAQAEKHEEKPVHAGSKRPPTSRKETKSAEEPPTKKTKPTSKAKGGKAAKAKAELKQEHAKEHEDSKDHVVEDKEKPAASSKAAGPWHAGKTISARLKASR